MNDQELYMNGFGRAQKSSPAPRRQVKYIGRPRAGAGKVERGESPAPPQSRTLSATVTAPSGPEESPPAPRRAPTPGFNSPSTRSEAQKKLQRELDDFNQELADIHIVEHEVSILAFNSPSFDGHKPGDLKQIQAVSTPSSSYGTLGDKLNRFHSPKQSRFEAAPPKGAAKPVLLVESTKRGNDDFGELAANASLALRASSMSPTAGKRASLFVPTRLPPSVAAKIAKIASLSGDTAPTKEGEGEDDGEGRD
jgi:hypothetical protein